ncbi:ribonuclease Z [Patescibacteria group bacterium]|nr:ribonuclease Z [Patescibacteria group bacterium]
MKAVFLGVGEAFDENYSNNSIIVVSDKTKILLDAGYSVPQQLWKYNNDPEFLDAIYISHIHADHCFGLPAILMRMWEDGRKKDLTIICQKELNGLLEYAYSSFQEKFEYKIIYVEPGNMQFRDLSFSFQETIHTRENLAIKINNSIAYSGDGSPQEDSSFYKDLDLLILETYLCDQEKVGHSSIVSGIAFAEKNNVKCLALTHINRRLRKEGVKKINSKVKVIIPEPLDEWEK